MTRTPRKPRTKKTKAPEQSETLASVPEAPETQALEQIQEAAPEAPETTTTPETAEGPPAQPETTETTTEAQETVLGGVLISESAPETSSGKQSVYKFCMCGCGGQTKARFAPGHDSRLKSRLLAAYRSEAGLSEDAEALVDQLGWRHLMTQAPAPKRIGPDPGTLADLRRQLAYSIDTARDRTRSREERLAAIHQLDRMFKAPLTAEEDLDFVVTQLDGEAE
jgi:hypothetical protein